MAKSGLITVVLAATVLAGTAGIAHAEPGKSNFTVVAAPTKDSFAPDQNLWGPQGSRKSFQFEDKHKWGLKLDMEQPWNREMQLKDVQAGAYFRVTPSVRVGGAVALGDTTVPDRKSTPNEQSPRVRLETNFKF